MKVAYLSIGMTGALNSSFELSRRLVAAGHGVTYLSPVDIRERVEAQGHAFVGLGPAAGDGGEGPCGLRGGSRGGSEEGSMDDGPAPRAGDLLRPWRWASALGRLGRARRASIADTEVVRAVEHVGPDLLLIDIEMHVAILKTRGLGIPTALPMMWFSIFRRPGWPPLHRDRPLATEGAGRLAVALLWWRLRLETLHLEWRQRLDRWRRWELAPAIPYDATHIDDVRAVARHWGFDTRRQTSRRHWLRPWTYTRLPILCCNGEEMDFSGSEPGEAGPGQALRYVGPMVHATRREVPAGDGSLAAWEAFVERRAGRARPLVYCSLGTFWSADEAFLTRIARVFVGRPDWDLVVGLGGRLDAGAVERIEASAGARPTVPSEGTSNMLWLPFAPQLDVLRHADVALTHGGIGSINECVLAGVPMVVYSTRFVDQNGCAQRVVHHGLGLVGDKELDGPEHIEAKIASALSDSALRGRVEAMGEALRADRYQGAAVEFLETLASEGRR